VVRTNIDIDDELLAEAMQAAGQKTKKQTVEDGLRALIKARRQEQAMRNLDGIGWGGDMDEIEASWSWSDETR
jgi:Arc/MetJ family transcription regulator